MTQTKSLTGLKITDDEKGQVRAVFSTLGVIDHDGDVTLPGAFTDGAKVRISAYNHASWGDALPVGKGTIHEDGNEAILEGQFFLNTTAGRDTFETVKELGELGEWSYGFDIVEAEQGTLDGQEVQYLKTLLVHEVSPVILGAGLGTRTLAAKAKGMKLTDHLDAVMADVKGAIDRAAEVKTLRSDQGKKLGEESSTLLVGLQSELKRLEEVLTTEEPVNTTPDVEALASEKARFLLLDATL